MSGSDALIQDYYGHQCSNPVHLTLDTGLNNQQMAVKAYVARTLTLGSRSEPLATQFQEVSCQVQTNAVERIGGSLLACLSVSIQLRIPAHNAVSNSNSVIIILGRGGSSRYVRVSAGAECWVCAV